jgi:hypothetical protein
MDGMGDVGVEAHATAFVVGAAFDAQLPTAIVTKASSEVVLTATCGTTIAELAGGHRDEEPVRSLNDLQIANHEKILDRDTRETAQLVRLILK